MKKTNSIMQVAGRILNKPLLIHSDSLNTVLSILNGHIDMQIPIVGKQAALPSSMSDRSGIASQNGVAVIPITGILSNKKDEFMEWMFGDTSYEAIRERFQNALNDSSVSAIILDIDSPGGEVSGCFDLVDEIYNARGIKPIYAIANEMAYSAAYAIASAAEKIFLPRTGGVGSIGVICVHLDQSKYDENIGVKYTPIYAGSHKVDFGRHAPLSSEAQQSAQDETNRIYDLFVKTVARNRGIDPQVVRDTQAGLLFGKNAVDIGLADSVMSSTKALSNVAKNKNSKGGNMKAILEKLRAITSDAPAEMVAAAMAELGFVPKAQAEQAPHADMAVIAAGLGIKPELLASDISKVDFAAIKSGMKKEAETEITVRVTGILETCSLAGMEKMAIGLITSGATVEDAKVKVLKAKADASDTTAIRSSVTALGIGEVNPLLADAQNRADANKVKKS